MATKKPKRMINVNGVEVEADKLPKSLVKQIDKAIKERQTEREKAKAEAEEAARPVPFTVPDLVKARPKLARFSNELGKALAEVAQVGMKFTTMQKDGQQVFGKLGTYEIAGTFEYTEELFPKPTVLFKARNLAEGDNVIEHAWSAFVHKDKHDVIENQLLDYVLKTRPDGQQTEEEEEV